MAAVHVVVLLEVLMVWLLCMLNSATGGADSVAAVHAV